MPPKLFEDKDLERGKRVIELRLFFQSKLRSKARSAFGTMLGGYNESTVRNWENRGDAIPNVALASFSSFGVDLHWLLTGEGEMMRQESQPDTTPDQSTPAQLRAMGHKLIELADQLENDSK